MRKLLYALIIWSVSVALVPANGFAVNRFWDGGGGDNNWSTAANWDGAAPVAGDGLYFGGAVRTTNSNNIAADTSFDFIIFQNGADPFTISGNRITLGGNVSNEDNSIQTIDLDMIMNSTRQFQGDGGALDIGGVLSGAGGLWKEGTNRLYLGGANTYTGATTVANGILELSGAGIIADTSAVDVRTGARLELNSFDETIGSLTGGGIVANIAAGSATLTIGGDGTNTTFSGTIQNDSGTLSITKTGAGTLTLSGANTYAGTTTVSEGTLKLGNSGVIPNTSAVTVSSGAALDLNNAAETIGSLAGAGTVTNSNAAPGLPTLTAGADNTSTTFTGVIENGAGGHAITFYKSGTGTLTMSGTNTTTGSTIIEGGTIALGGDLAFGGNLTLSGVGSTLALGTNTLTLNGTGRFTLQPGNVMNLSINSSGSFGSVQATGANSGITGGTVNVTIGSQYIASGTTFTVVNTGGGTTTVPTINVTGSSRTTLTGANLNGDLILTASRATNGFSSDATDSNGRAVGTVLDNITSPSSDMTTVLNTMEGLSASQAGSALDAMVPQVDSGIQNTSTVMLNNFVGVAIERTEDVLRLARAPGSASSGFSAGDPEEKELLNAIWAKGYGSYLDQGTRKGIAGYSAWNAGTAVGIDRLFADVATVGISGGYAYGDVDSDVNNANTYINSAQATLYAGYRNDEYPFYIDLNGSFAWNWYNGKRDIVVGAINRTANASYDGQQYGAYIGGGYDFDVYKQIILTPLLSLQWMHLHLQSYTETEAGALNLSIASQDYDILQSGIGAGISGPIEFKWGTLIPEVHGKWLYDFFGETVVMTSTFTGGGASFNADGARPARNSFNVGGKLGIDLKNNISILLECDTELKDEFWGIYGAGTVRYRF